MVVYNDRKHKKMEHTYTPLITLIAKYQIKREQAKQANSIKNKQQKQTRNNQKPLTSFLFNCFAFSQLFHSNTNHIHFFHNKAKQKQKHTRTNKQKSKFYHNTKEKTHTLANKQTNEVKEATTFFLFLRKKNKQTNKQK